MNVEAITALKRRKERCEHLAEVLEKATVTACPTPEVPTALRDGMVEILLTLAVQCETALENSEETSRRVWQVALKFFGWAGSYLAALIIGATFL